MKNSTKFVGSEQAIDLRKVPAAVWERLVGVRFLIQYAQEKGDTFEEARAFVLKLFAEQGEEPSSVWLDGCYFSQKTPDRASFATEEELPAAFVEYQKGVNAEKQECATYERVLADAKAIFPEAGEDDLHPYVEKEAVRRKAVLQKDCERGDAELPNLARGFYPCRRGDNTFYYMRRISKHHASPAIFAQRVLFDRLWRRLKEENVPLYRSSSLGARNSSRRSSPRGPRNSSRRPSRTAVGVSSPGDSSGDAEPPSGDPDLPRPRDRRLIPSAVPFRDGVPQISFNDKLILHAKMAACELSALLLAHVLSQIVGGCSR
jgi:hypothetical protein